MTHKSHYRAFFLFFLADLFCDVIFGQPMRHVGVFARVFENR